MCLNKELGKLRARAGPLHYLSAGGKTHQASSGLGIMPSPDNNPLPHQPLRAVGRVWVPGKSCPSFSKCLSD